MTDASFGQQSPQHNAREFTWTGFRWRVMLSILGPIAWLCFTLLYVGFWAQGLTLFQSVIVILVSILILGGVMGATWSSWGFNHRNQWERWAREKAD